jgi:aspartate-semialdehyde dehydrogenase
MDCSSTFSSILTDQLNAPVGGTAGTAIESKNEGKKVGICGATGAVGIELIDVLFQRQFPISKLFLFASKRSAGKQMDTPFGQITIEEFTLEKAATCDYVFFAVSGSFSLQFGRQLAALPNGPVVIDNSSAFRQEPDIPLVIPEINGHVLESKPKLIANPNCTTAIAAMALWPLHCEFGIKKLIVSTYQAASGAGTEGMQELRDGTAAFLEEKQIENKIFAYPLPFNLIPHIDTFQANGYTKEEMKVTWETKKIFEETNLLVSCTATRIPIMRAHSEAITIETKKKITPEAARQVLLRALGVDVVDDPLQLKYPMPLNASKKYNIEVGRLRQSLVFGSKGLDFFVSGDQLLRGAALNAVLIAEQIEKPSICRFYKKMQLSSFTSKWCSFINWCPSSLVTFNSCTSCPYASFSFWYNNGIKATVVIVATAATLVFALKKRK